MGTATEPMEIQSEATQEELHHLRIIKNRNYALAFKNELEALRKTEVPFIDVNEEGKTFTANANGDWKRMLKLSEILTHLGEGAWAIIEDEIRDNPSWFQSVHDNRVANGQGPLVFQYGRLNLLKEIIRIVKKHHPQIEVKLVKRKQEKRTARRKRLKYESKKYKKS